MSPTRTRVVFATATSLDGYLADPAHSLEWLFAVEGGQEALAEMADFVDGVGVLVMGSSTYTWVVEHENLTEEPQTWTQHYGQRPTFVFTSRPEQMPVLAGLPIRFVSGAVSEHIAAVLDAAGGADVWLMGGGDLAAQFAEAGHLDELRLSVAPVLLGAGAPLFTGRLDSTRLTLTRTHRTGQFLQARYTLGKAIPVEA